MASKTRTERGICKPLTQGRFISRWNKPADPAGGTRSECYEYENTLGLNDEVLYVLEGTTTFLIGETWVDVDKGTFLGIHTKTNHNTMNTTRNRTGVLDIIIPDGFERNMPSIVKWFEGGREV